MYSVLCPGPYTCLRCPFFPDLKFSDCCQGTLPEIVESICNSRQAQPERLYGLFLVSLFQLCLQPGSPCALPGRLVLDGHGPFKLCQLTWGTSQTAPIGYTAALHLLVTSEQACPLDPESGAKNIPVQPRVQGSSVGGKKKTLLSPFGPFFLSQDKGFLT